MRYAKITIVRLVDQQLYHLLDQTVRKTCVEFAVLLELPLYSKIGQYTLPYASNELVLLESLIDCMLQAKHRTVPDGWIRE